MLIAVLVIFVMLAAACDKDDKQAIVTEDAEKPVVTEVTPVTAETTVDAEALKEAPMLAEMVKAGTIPAVAERMPVAADIMVQEVVEEIGQYGGDWNMPWNGANDRWLTKPASRSCRCGCWIPSAGVPLPRGRSR